MDYRRGVPLAAVSGSGRCPPLDQRGRLDRLKGMAVAYRVNEVGRLRKKLWCVLLLAAYRGHVRVRACGRWCDEFIKGCQRCTGRLVCGSGPADCERNRGFRALRLRPSPTSYAECWPSRHTVIINWLALSCGCRASRSGASVAGFSTALPRRSDQPRPRCATAAPGAASRESPRP